MFKDSLRETVARIRKGEIDNSSLAKLLEGEEFSGNENDQPSVALERYVKKAKFATEAKKRGAEYASSHGDEGASAIHGPFEQVFVLHISADAQAHVVWPATRQKVWDLLDFRRPDDCVVIEDHDVVGTNSSKLDRPVIEKYMGGELQIKDVVEDDKDLAAKCLIKCSDRTIIKFSRNTYSFDGRPVKMHNALVNYLRFENLDAALNDREPLRYHIPTHFEYEELVDGPHQRGKGSIRPYVITVGSETETERLSKTGQSAMSRSKIYNFSIGPAMLRIIDTPGMNDTKDIRQDQEDIRDILETLESVDKLSGIMIMLPIVKHRVTPNFRRYMTDLLSTIHIDASENILFGYPHANSTQWRSSDVQIALRSTLDQLKLKISTSPDAKNPFMFEAEPFRYLAACKQLERHLPGREKYDAMWNTSCGQINELINRLEELPVHEVGKTLCLKRTRDLLNGMPKPLTKIVSIMKESQKSLERIKNDLSELKTDDDRFNEKLNKLQIPIFILKRKDLPNTQQILATLYDSFFSPEDSITGTFPVRLTFTLSSTPPT
jgi:hypothetical protein